MSFVKKAVKKVFKFAKKVVKKTASFLKRAWNNKWVRMAVIIAASVFTAGLAAPGGFAAFSSTMASQGFFAAVGNTMAAGWSAITTSISNFGTKFMSAFSGAAPAAEASTLAAQGTFVGPLASNVGTAMTASAGGAAGASIAAAEAGFGAGVVNSAFATLAPSTAGLATASTFLSPLASNVTPAASKGFFGKLGQLLVDPGWGGTLLRSGIANGLTSYYKNKDAERQEWYYRNRTVWGGPAFGGKPGDDYINIAQPVHNWNPSGGGEQGGLLAQASQQAAQPTPAQQAAMQGGQNPALLAQGGMNDPRAMQQIPAAGVPAQQTQPPPAAQPAPQHTPGLLQLETMGAYA